MGDGLLYLPIAAGKCGEILERSANTMSELRRDPIAGRWVIVDTDHPSGWQVRVVANKFPALQVEGELDRRGLGIYDMSNGIGAHEVLIESPYHHKDIPDLLNQEIENAITMLCRRAKDLIKDLTA